MSKSGPKAKPQSFKVVGGTDRADRKNEQLFDDLAGKVLLPDAYQDLKEESPRMAIKVLRIWNRKLSIYNLRSQSVVGFESLLYQYCYLEAAINEKQRTGMDISPAVLGQYRAYASEFYDSPASQLIVGGTSGRNPFSNNGRPPRL